MQNNKVIYLSKNQQVDVNLSNQSSDLSGEYIYDPNKKKPLTNDEIVIHNM